MFRFATRQDLVTGARVVDVPRGTDAIRAVGLVLVIISVSLAARARRRKRPQPGDRGHAWPVRRRVDRLDAGRKQALDAGRRSLVVMGAAGGVLAGLSPNSPAVAIGCAACFSAGVRLRTEVSLGIVAETVAAFLVTALAIGAPTGALLGFPFAFAGLWSVSPDPPRATSSGPSRLSTPSAETRRAREAETQAAALAERARIARDIHDVLAHSLAAVSVNLQAAEGLLSADSLPADNPELTKAVECIDRAGTLDPRGPGGRPPGRPGPARRRRAAARSAVVAGCPVPRGRRPGRGLHRHRRRRGRCPRRPAWWRTGRRRKR